MRQLDTVEAKLVEVLLKTACAFVFGNPAVATLTGELAGWTTQSLTRQQKRDIRNVRTELHNLVETISERLVKQYGQEFRDLDDGESAAALLAVASTFDDDSVFDIAHTDLTSTRMMQCLRKRRTKILRAERLSADAKELYDIALKWTCQQLVLLLGQLPDVKTAAMGEILTRSRTLVEQLVDSPEIIFAKVRNSTDAQFTAFYLEQASLAIDRVDLHTSLVPSSRHYSLAEAHVPSLAVRDDLPDQVLSAEQAMFGTSRVLITGAPGIGKSTLAKWLFDIASRKAFGSTLATLNGRIPFYVSLRTHNGLPAPSDFLHPIVTNWSNLAPRGWVERQLRAGRGLVLINGLDELPAAQRTTELEQIATFTTDMTKKGNVVVLTSRRAAIPSEWLKRTGFRTVELMPLRPQDVMPFITRWHDAAIAANPDAHEHERIRLRRDALLGAVRRNSHLRLLAANPLCCALMCALHLDKEMVLPRDWLHLIDLVLAALAERDITRGIPIPSSLSSVQLLGLERDFAHWIVTNGPNPVNRSQIQARIGKAIQSVGLADPDVSQVIDDLLCRSGLLYSQSDGRVIFTNPVVRDHLAASEFVSGSDIGFLRKEARSPERHRLVVAAIGRARGDGLRELISGLLDDAEARPEDATLLKLVVRAAVNCIHPGEESSVDARARSFEGLPLYLDGYAKTQTGSLLLDVLPDITDLDDQAAAAVVTMAVNAAAVAGAEAVAALARFADDPRLIVQEQLWEAWPLFDRLHYASEVLSGCQWCPDQVVVDCQEAVEAVAHHLPMVGALAVSGCQMDVTALASRDGLTILVSSPDDVRGVESLGDGVSVVVRVAEGRETR